MVGGDQSWERVDARGGPEYELVADGRQDRGIIPAAVPEERRSLESAPARRSTLPSPKCKGPLGNLKKERRPSVVQLVCISRWARRKCFVTSSLLIPSTAATSGSVYP